LVVVVESRIRNVTFHHTTCPSLAPLILNSTRAPEEKTAREQTTQFHGNILNFQLQKWKIIASI
jgi:hypothetical protein